MKIREINRLACNPTMEGQVKLVQDVIYSTETGTELPMTLILPWKVCKLL